MKSRLISLAAALTLALPGFAAAQKQSPASPAPATVSTKVADTKTALRELWIGHVFWVRNVVEARLAGEDARAKASEEQVVANAKAIAGAIEPFYGQAASDQLFKLLAGHWGAISEYLNATRDGNRSAADAASGKLTANADEIAKFLSGANPHLPYATVRGLLTAHGAQHAQQIQQLKAKQYGAEAKTWEAMSKHIYMISDALATGIAAQFPDKFR